MTNGFAVVGDIHGDNKQLLRLLQLDELNNRVLVFVGDYINRGPDSQGVLNTLITLSRTAQKRPVFLRGNHEEEFLSYLDGTPIAQFLRMGGGSTVLSWLPNVNGDVRSKLIHAISAEQMNFLRSLDTEWHSAPFHAAHLRSDLLVQSLGPDDLLIVGHYIQRDLRPRIVDNCAYIDTGCGSTTGGYLTALLLPELSFINSEE